MFFFSPWQNYGYGKKRRSPTGQQAASEVGVNLTNGYNGHLTSREAGSVGGQIVKNGTPERTKFFARQSRIKEGYCDNIRYIFRFVV